MTALCLILAACPAILLGAVAFLAVIAVGVRTPDHHDLYTPARNRIDAITRRVVGVGTRNGERRDK
jgi:hypothetical protein